ncbi:MAG: hypothetical protein PHP54_04690 [Clostridia bacterium]|nr:hypothetical protein [Clostridia bacterium]
MLDKKKKINEKKIKTSKKIFVTLLIVSIVIIISIILIVVYYNKNKTTEKVYDNIDNYEDVKIEQEDITINGITFFDFKYKTSKDAQVFFLKFKNATDKDITEKRRYQISLLGGSFDLSTNEIFAINELKAGEEQEISIAIKNKIISIKQIVLSEY